MADTIVVDLPMLEAFLDEPRNLVGGSLRRLVAEVAISPEIVAAIHAGEFGVFGRIVGPGDASAALFAFERGVSGE